MNPLKSVGAVLSIALSFVVMGALLIVYFMVVPSLQSRLINTRLTQLQRDATALRMQYGDKPPGEFVETAAARTDARILIMNALARGLTVVEDSMGSSQSSVDVQTDPIALQALASGTNKHGTLVRGRVHLAEVAIVPTPGTVILVTASLASQFQTIHVVKRRMLIAGLVALAVALAVGYGGAWAFARRIKRLERAAERISAGRFDEPVIDPSQDELGELARAFDRMRIRVAQLDDARRAFIANASHELRTPLFSLGGFLELMADEDLDEATRQEFLSAMREQVARLTKLATDLLDLSRLDAGRIGVERQTFALWPLAEAVAEEFSLVARSNEHPLEVVPGDDARAVGDPDRVLQIARLLVENAIVHTPAGTPVRVRVATEDGRAVLAVEDEGPGIPEGDAEQVFERFYRADGSRSSGSGLGLAIARELARLMGGTIELDSRPGRTVFALKLPTSSGEGDEQVQLSRGTSLTT
jgi:signal transduction histidine kinase